MSDVTRPLEAAAAGDRRAADDLLPVVYDELRKLAAAQMAREKPGQTLDATSLVHEAYLRLVEPADERRWDHCGHFFAAAAEAMRRILVERARRRKAEKHGGRTTRAELDPDELPSPGINPDIVALSDAVDRLAGRDPQAAELVKLRHFAGLSIPQAAEALGVSPRTADRLWVYARAWLLRELRGR
jgi:RNA polymerase sigma factor (TIGR02999 family)